MNIYDRATDIHVQLKAAREADSSDAHLLRGRAVRTELDDAAAFAEAVNLFQQAASVKRVPDIDVQRFGQAVKRFRSALSKSGPAAVQQQSATTLLKLANSETSRLRRWVKSIWKSRFEEFQNDLDRAPSGNLSGSNDHRKTAFRCASLLRNAQNTDPIDETTELEQLLDSQGIDACLEQIGVLGNELRRAIKAIEQEHASLTSEVQAVLKKAGSDKGLPLAEITSDDLEALESAGVLDSLVVRRL